MIKSHLVEMVLRPVWRMRRGLTLGAQGCVIDAHGQVLLVRHAYRPGWHFPGGGVEWGETIETALGRELAEEAGIEITGPPELHGVFANFAKFPGDHIAVYIVRSWQRPKVPRPNHEIAESSFFACEAIPRDTSTGTQRRLGEILDGQQRVLVW
jgi:ADP-ribose pyrophosphatase YjhB (NUDIX family)